MGWRFVVCMVDIHVAKKDEGLYEVVVEDGSRTMHEVTVKEEDYQRLTKGKISVEELLKKSFLFLLEREPKESILSSFDLMLIQRYFPEYEKTMQF